ncbi:hypothetical protein CKF54_06175 [Psittacicella hinzii]|uniref:undecaprenyl-diphosphate phosphatase n=1 Tax=Psittacicella hinzii TaxID=2028575 RepID=A0A3A1Y3E6_9GAMM|nr:phosphatase PAP2 family protein [Psittacicella hinzii]RIY31738.1 hypothetical protein CKF54_06175 [Psittacicella hinzii]
MKFRYFYLPLLVLLALPLAFIFSGYTWDLNKLATYSSFWDLITVTANPVAAVIISILLLAVLLYFYRANFKLCIAIAVYCFAAVVATQVIKSVVKNTLEEPRPFTYQIAYRLQEIDAERFISDFEKAYKSNPSNPSPYQADLAGDDSIGNLINSLENGTYTGETTIDVNDDQAPKRVQDYLDYYFDKLDKEKRIAFIRFYENSYMQGPQEETRRAALDRLADESPYSFPSGHSIFAATWMMIFMVMAFMARKASFWLVTAGVVTWGLLVEASRIILGYHYAHDVLASNIIAACVIGATFWIMSFMYRLLSNREAKATETSQN